MAEDLQFKVKVSAETGGLDQIEGKVTDLGNAVKETAGEFKGFSDEEKKAAQALADSLPPLKKTATEAENLSKTLGQTKQAVSGLGNVLSGIFTGDVIQAGKGLLDLEKAAAAATGSMKAFLASVASGAAIGAALAAPILVAIYKWKTEAEAADKEMQEIWANQGRSTRALAEEQEASTQRMISNNEAIAASYRRITAEIDVTISHTRALNAEKTKQAVALATTPEGKRAAQEAGEVGAADLEINAAMQGLIAAEALGNPEDTARARRALEVAQERRKTVAITQGAAAQSRGNEMMGQGGVLASRAAQQFASGDVFGGLGTISELNKLTASIKATGKQIEKAVGDAWAASDEQGQRMKVQREMAQGAGG